MLAETIFQKFFPNRKYEIQSGADSDKVFSPGFEVSHNRKTQVLLATRPGDMYGRRYVLHMKGEEIEVLALLLSDRFSEAEKYIDECEQLVCESAAGCDSGYYYNDVIKAISIAAGKI